MADFIPWDEYEKKYRCLFKSKTGNIAKPFRMALGSLIIQQKYQYSDRELVEQITENPYLQYFIGLPGYQEKAPFDASTLVLFRRRINAKMLMDATCAPVNIRYPQDISLLNEAREKLEVLIFWFHKTYGVGLPRRDCRAARKAYLNYAKARKPSSKQVRKAIKKQLSYVRRNIGYINSFMSDGYALLSKDIDQILTIFVLYEQQLYMFENKVHKVEDRIVSISQPWIRPIVRGKVKAPVEYGAKLDLSIDAEGYARIEKVQFDAYNESGCLQEAVEAFHKRTGHYPERILADQIYRTRQNRAFCKEHGIRLSGPKLGRPNAETQKTDKKQEYQDNTDRIEVERRFSLAKRCYGLGMIRTKLKETQLTSIALSVFVANLFRKMQRILFTLLFCFGFYPMENGLLTA